MWRCSPALVLLVLAAASAASAANAAASSPALGRPVDEARLRAMNLTVLPDGTGLPEGRGTARAGKAVFEAKCLACHGVEGKGGTMDVLTGGVGTLASDRPVKTVSSYWPYATTVFDYIRRAMPLLTPQTLSADETYALTAYLLSIDGVVKPDQVLDARTLPRVQMPNRDGFISWWPRAGRSESTKQGNGK